MDVDQILKSIHFQCHHCGKQSNCSNLPDKRDVMTRLIGDPNTSIKFSVYCEHCGNVNEIEATEEDSKRVDISSLDIEGLASKFLR